MNEQRGGRSFRHRLHSQKETPTQDVVMYPRLSARIDTYHANTLAQSRGNRVEDVHRWTDPLHEPLITISKVIKRHGLAFEYV